MLKALKIEENEPNILYSLAECHQGIGETDEAKKCILKILKIQPKNALVHKFLSGITNYKKDGSNFDDMKDIYESEDFEKYSPEQKMNLCFALGKALEEKENFQDSFEFLKKANSIGKSISNYQISSEEKLFDNIIKTFQQIYYKKFNKKILDKKIIFICGMPRSGTTLVEQIIAAHSNVSGAGELEYLQNIVKNIFLENLNLNKEKIIEEGLYEKNIIGQKYIEFLNFHNFETKVITDKAPQNFIWLGFIKIFFPNAKIIHCSRDSKDNCLSLYKNYFPSKDMLWSFDQTDIAKYYKLYSKLMNFWKSQLSDSIFDINYEKLVSDPENQIKKIIEFCDLEWEQNCLSFHKNTKTPIQTVSVNQARKPIYKSSVNSNQKFSQHLSEMFSILDN